MDNYKVPAYPVSRTDIIRDGGYYDVNGLWNSIKVFGDGYLVRHRVETFIFRETEDDRLEVYLRKYNDGTYRLPGGSITKGVSDKVQAMLECNEEARIKVKDMEYTGVHYVKMNTKKMKDTDPNIVHWDGSYNDVYAGFYDGPYTGEVKDIDQDNDMYKNGAFYLVDDSLLSIITPEHKPIFDRLREVGILENTEDVSKDITSTIDDKAIELCVFATNFLTRCKDNTITISPVPHDKIEDMYTVANYQCYSDDNMAKFINLLNELNNTDVMRERYKEDNFGIIIPSKDAYSGVLYLKSGIAPVSENAGLHDDKNPVYIVKPEEDWMNTILNHDSSDEENKKKLVDSGIEPDADIPIGEAAMIADKIISSCTEGIIINVNEKYIFSEKDGFYNFDKWEFGESNILLITGLSGSGKTTKAKALMKQYKAKFIQLDEFQCHNANKNGKGQTTTSRLIDIYLKENPDIDSAKFTELTAEDFPNYFIPFFDWLMERLSTDKDNKYIIEGLHICLYVPYNTIKEYPLYCMNTSMTKSIIRHWIRDGWSFRDFLKHGSVDIKLFEEWEKQYNSFKDNISESYVEEKSEEYGIPEKKKYPMPDKKHVFSAIRFFNYVDKEDEKELAENIKKKMKYYKIDSSHVGKNNRLKNYLDESVDFFNEGYAISDKDIYYNKEKFDSGEVKLCCITGLSGSGKSTMGRNLQSNIIEHYELDDVIFNFNFSDSELKEYGDLMYSFFTGVGRSFRYKSKQELYDDKRWITDNFKKGYEYSIIRAFVMYSKKYVTIHKDKKIVLDGIWFYSYIEPSELDDCAVYIKGTSALISKLRAAKRDSSDAENNIERVPAFFKIFTKNWKYYILDEKRIKVYRDYFLKKEKSAKDENNFNESADVNVNTLPIIKETIKDGNRLIIKNHGDIIAKLDWFDYNIENFDWVLIANIDTKQKYRRRGLATKLINKAYKEIASATHKGVYMFVKADNDNAIKLYKKLQFKYVKNYNVDGVEYIIMAKGPANITQFNNMNFS